MLPRYIEDWSEEDRNAYERVRAIPGCYDYAAVQRHLGRDELTEAEVRAVCDAKDDRNMELQGR